MTTPEVSVSTGNGERVGDVLIVDDGPVVRATIDRPEARNAISASVVDGL
jgi:enoyl-CoA hydratase/carnithine racemase